MKYILFIGLFLLYQLSVAQQNSPEKQEEEKENSVSPAMNSNYAEPVVREEIRKKDKSTRVMSAQDIVSPESSLIQQRYVQASAAFQNTYSTSKKSTSRKSATPEEIMEMNLKLESMRSANPTGFEYQLAEYQIGNYDVSKIGYLKEAERLNPTNKEVQIQLAAYYEITDGAEKLTYLKKLSDSKYFSDDLLNYAQLVLATMPKNGVLITHGTNDTYPLWMLQDINNYRSDVTIMSLDLMQSQAYRQRFAKKGFRLPTSSFVDTQFLKELVQLNTSIGLHISMTVPSPYLNSIRSFLEIEGLSFTTNRADFATKNQHIYQQLLKELEGLYIPKTTLGKNLQLNLTPMLLVIRNTAVITNDKRLLKKVEKQLIELAKAGGKEQQIKSLMK